MNYDETMAYGAAQYADVVIALRNLSLPAEFVQTGGTCAAIEVSLEAGYRLLICDREDTLSWECTSHEGWYVGLYAPADDGGDPSRWAETTGSEVADLMELVRRVLSGGVVSA